MIGKYYKLKNIKLMIGSGGTTQKGFIATDIDFLDIRNWWHWRRSFVKNSISHILAEHVFEHLSNQEIRRTLKLMHYYMKPEGRVRIAIPDKNRLDLKYLKSVTPPVDGHKSLLGVGEISEIFKSAGFKPVPLEYFNSKGEFIHYDWDEKDGKILRSFKYDKQKDFKIKNYHYTSLIVDGIKT